MAQNKAYFNKPQRLTQLMQSCAELPLDSAQHPSDKKLGKKKILKNLAVCGQTFNFADENMRGTSSSG